MRYAYGGRGARSADTPLQMKDQLLRFDSLIAVIALLMSTVTAGAMVYQTHVIQEQFAATIWPYLSVVWDNNPDSVDVHLANDGAGPALVRSAQLQADGKVLPTWNDLFRLIFSDPRLRTNNRKTFSAGTQASSVDASTIVRAGASAPLAAVVHASPQVLRIVRSHRIALSFCYCSINGSCWTIRSALESNELDIPQPVAYCRIGSSIGSHV
jgi:hypothetical protein